MKSYTQWRIVILLGITLLLSLGCKQKRTILAGTDYLKTQPGSDFELSVPGGKTVRVTFVGNPRSGNAYDTAIMRMDDVTIEPGGSGKTKLQMTELSLKSDKPVDINGQQYNLSVSLDPNKQSTGTMTITEDVNAQGSGGFTSSFDQINFVVAFEPTGKGEKLPDFHTSTSLVNDGSELPAGKWVSDPKQANPPCTTVSPKPKGAHDTNSHTTRDKNDLDIFPNGQINENHNHTSRWHKAACI
jgi:hypothetical protein